MHRHFRTRGGSWTESIIRIRYKTSNGNSPPKLHLKNRNRHHRITSPCSCSSHLVVSSWSFFLNKSYPWTVQPTFERQLHTFESWTMFHLQETWTPFGWLIDVVDMLADIINMFFLVGWCGGKFWISHPKKNIQQKKSPQVLHTSKQLERLPERKRERLGILGILSIQELMHWDGGMKRLKEPTKKWGLVGLVEDHVTGGGVILPGMIVEMMLFGWWGWQMAQAK